MPPGICHESDSLGKMRDLTIMNQLDSLMAAFSACTRLLLRCTARISRSKHSSKDLTTFAVCQFSKPLFDTAMFSESLQTKNMQNLLLDLAQIWKCCSGIGNEDVIIRDHCHTSCCRNLQILKFIAERSRQLDVAHFSKVPIYLVSFHFGVWHSSSTSHVVIEFGVR